MTVSDERAEEQYKDDYVYMKFDGFEEFEIIISDSYYSKNRDREIMFSNYSEDG